MVGVGAVTRFACSRGLGLGAIRAVVTCATLLASRAQAAAAHELQALGLPAGANDIDVQAAYKELVSELRAPGPYNGSALDRLAEVQRAYEAVSDFGMREEALEFVDYWSEVRYVSTDDDLRRFTELQVGGSAQLRVIFVVARPDVRVYPAFAASLRLQGLAKVAQLCHKSMFGSGGQLGNFYSDLKVFEGGVVIFDPISRGSKITYDVDGVARSGDLERLLTGQGGKSKLLRVQELDARAYNKRCPEGVPPGQSCSWLLVVATDQAFEENRAENTQLLKEFSEACMNLQANDSGPRPACFWLRLQRSPEMKAILGSKFPAHFKPGVPTSLAFHLEREDGVLGKVKVFAADAGTALPSQTPAPMGTVTSGLTRWMTTVVEGDLAQQPQLLDGMPPIPPPMMPEEEPKDAFKERAWRLFFWAVACAYDHDCLIGNAEQTLIKAGVIYPDSTQESKTTMMIGTGACVVLGTIFILRQFCLCFCCKRRATKMSDEEIIKLSEPTIVVPLQKPHKDAKYGLGIAPAPSGGLLINGVEPSGLAGRWNEMQSVEAARVRPGDRVIRVTYVEDGKETVASTTDQMKKAFTKESLTLLVAVNRGEAEIARLVGSAALDGLDAGTDLTLLEVEGGTLGMEVVQVSPKVEERNAQRRSEGSCQTQIIETGDRLLMQRDTPAGTSVVILKFRYPHEVRTDTFEVAIEKNGPEDRLGMQVRAFPGEPKHMEVLDVLKEGAVFRTCSSGSAAMVLRGDRLIGANGKQGSADMGAQFREQNVVLRLERWHDAASAPVPVGAKFYEAAAPATAFAPLQAAAATGAFAAPLPGAPVAPAVPSAPSALWAPSAPSAPFAAAPLASPMAPPPAAAGDGSVGGGLRLTALLVLALAALVAVFGRNPPSAVANMATIRFYPELVGQIPYSTKMFLDRIPQELYGDVAVVLLLIGVVLTFNFLAYEVSMLRRPEDRRVLPQLCVAGAASHCLGFGALFLFTWAGVYAP